ncbi:MAG TPA: hypothetical protein VGL26_01520 [Jatrophihabitans sp.]
MQPPPLYDPLALPRVLSREAARKLGFSNSAIDGRVARGNWQRLLPRTYLTARPLSQLDRLRAALVYAGDGALLSSAAALRVYGFDRIAWPPSVLVVVPPENRTRSREWVCVRNSPRLVEREPQDGLATVRVARAVADYSLDLRRIDDVRALVAEAVRRSRCTVDELADELRSGPRSRSALLRRALEDVLGGAASAPEARAASILKRAGLNGFEQNVKIRLPSGRYYVADFLWRDLKAILEIDSVEFHLGPAEWRATMDRHLALETLRYSVIHRPPSALSDEPRFIADVRGWLRSR